MATKSCKFLTPSVGDTTTRAGASPAIKTPAKSVTASKLRFLVISAEMTWPELAIWMV